MVRRAMTIVTMVLMVPVMLMSRPSHGFIVALLPGIFMPDVSPFRYPSIISPLTVTLGNRY